MRADNNSPQIHLYSSQWPNFLCKSISTRTFSPSRERIILEVMQYLLQNKNPQIYAPEDRHRERLQNILAQ